MRPLGLFAFIAGGIGLLFSCARKQERDLPEVSLKEEMSIDAFSDSTYFSDVWSMVEADGDLYLCETRRRQIVRLDAHTLSLRNTVGESGEGPENTFYVQYVQVWAIRFWPPTLLSNACSISIGRDIICIRTTDFLNGRSEAAILFIWAMAVLYSRLRSNVPKLLSRSIG